MSQCRTALTVVTCLMVLGGCTDSPKREAAPDQQLALVAVPELTNQKYFRIKKLIDQARLEIGTLEHIGTGVAGTVLEQDPSAGTEVPEGTQVNLVVSKVFPAPLLSVPQVGEFAWTCLRQDTTTITFTVDPRGASTRVRYMASSGEERSRLTHPGRSVTAPLAGRRSWTLLQATEPRTVRAKVSIQEPRACHPYIPPQTNLVLRGKSHSQR